MSRSVVGPGFLLCWNYFIAQCRRQRSTVRRRVTGAVTGAWATAGALGQALLDFQWGHNLKRGSDSGVERCDRFFGTIAMSGRETTSRGGEPEFKRRRLLDSGGPVEDEETARQKMRDAQVGEPGGGITGFDSDDIDGLKTLDGTPYRVYEISPMGYFCWQGDLPMVRWLYGNGADTRDENVGLYFPMYIAARTGKLEACTWLYHHGAAHDVTRVARSPRNSIGGTRPLHNTFCRAQLRDVSRWLILRGAMCKNFQSGELDIDVMKKDLGGDSVSLDGIEERKLLLDWANDLHQARASFLFFLSGTLSPPNHAGRTRRSSSPLRNLNGHTGALQTIGDYVGIVRGREARIIRQLTELLPDLNKELDAA